MKAIRTAVSLPNIFDLQALVSLPSLEQFQKENNPAYDFLQIFLKGDLGSYRAFNQSHPTWMADNRIIPFSIASHCADFDSPKAERKIRLLTLASLANTPSRTLSYAKISESLDIPKEDVEVWLIDIIRAGLVEGKLSQARQELLVHRSTYRTFGREEWEELESRLEDWRVALEAILTSGHIAALREHEQGAATVMSQSIVNGASTSNAS
jgi:translation initiation factor 3 subunit M